MHVCRLWRQIFATKLLKDQRYFLELHPDGDLGERGFAHPGVHRIFQGATVLVKIVNREITKISRQVVHRDSGITTEVDITGNPMLNDELLYPLADDSSIKQELQQEIEIVKSRFSYQLYPCYYQLIQNEMPIWSHRGLPELGGDRVSIQNMLRWMTERAFECKAKEFSESIVNTYLLQFSVFGGRDVRRISVHTVTKYLW
ncbi:hypothetical protein ABW19_dt0204054 [Dactylella cylindrospora]|nr:hypothetical protein ABW19_dt0204054 [Dactylella cylindrospora]